MKKVQNVIYGIMLIMAAWSVEKVVSSKHHPVVSSNEHRSPEPASVQEK